MPRRFDSTIAATFLVAIRAGASNEIAAQHTGVDLEVVREWLRGGTPAKDQFRMDVEKARADLELLAVGTVRRQMGEDKGAAQWLAEKVRGDAELERLRELTT
jgi:hypothetical protein